MEEEVTTAHPRKKAARGSKKKRNSYTNADRSTTAVDEPSVDPPRYTQQRALSASA